ncbi:MAG: hypothetical protein IH944_12775 [Armatimonadetes bacterium]|nr:hypothetical protein [Armatimonadota bacterium]
MTIVASLLAASAFVAPSGAEITIYNQGFALVKEQRTLNLIAGIQEVAIEDVAALIEANSVGIRSLSSSGSFSVLEQNYRYDLISPQAILNKAVGKQIIFNRVLPDGSKERISGILLSAPTAVISQGGGRSSMTWNGMVIRTDDGRIILNPSGEIEVSTIPEGLISRPTLIWLVDSIRAGPQTVELSYITQGMSWTADYVLSLNKEGTIGDLKGWVTLTNNSGATFPNAKLKLLAGEVFRVGPKALPMSDEGVATMRAGAGGGFAEEQFSEYHLYTLGRPTDVRNREMKQVSLLEAFDVPVRRKLIVDAMRNYRNWQPREGGIGRGLIKPLVFYEFKNDEASNLGMPLPRGIVKVFQRDSTDSLQLVGEAPIDHTPKNEEISLPVGRAFDVIAERHRTEFQWLGNRRTGTVETYEIELRNRKDEPATVHVYERFFSEWSFRSTSHKFDKLDSHTVDFVIDLKAGEVMKIVYTVETRWG